MNYYRVRKPTNKMRLELLVAATGFMLLMSNHCHCREPRQVNIIIDNPNDLLAVESLQHSIDTFQDGGSISLTNEVLVSAPEFEVEPSRRLPLLPKDRPAVKTFNQNTHKAVGTPNAITNSLGTPTKVNLQTLGQTNRQSQTKTNKGYTFRFEVPDGSLARSEEGKVGSNGGINTSGNWKWIAPDGQTFTLKFTADENGYRPVGSHLPTPPPLPASHQKYHDAALAVAAASARRTARQRQGRRQGQTRTPNNVRIVKRKKSNKDFSKSRESLISKLTKTVAAGQRLRSSKALRKLRFNRPLKKSGGQIAFKRIL